MLPLILFASGIVLHDYLQARREAMGRVLDTVRSMRLVIDAEVQRMTGGLQVLALADSLQEGDFERFRRLAGGFLAQYGEGGILLVADRGGRQLFSSIAENAPLPQRANLDILERVFAAKAPQYSDLFKGSIAKRLVVTVEVPVMRDGDVIYDICFIPPIETFQHLI